MILTHINPVKVILQNVISYIGITMTPCTRENELVIEISEEALLKAANAIVKDLPGAIKHYTGEEREVCIDKVSIKIGPHEIKGSWKTTEKIIKEDIGFIKESI